MPVMHDILAPVKRESSLQMAVPTLDMELKNMIKESIDASERILKGLPNRVKSPTEE